MVIIFIFEIYFNKCTEFIHQNIDQSGAKLSYEKYIYIYID